jgi:uncharacterized protein (TIGR02466 family)
MQKETTIGNLFGKSIYKCTINNYDEYNKPLIKDIESFVKEKPGSVAATTDVTGNVNYTKLNDAVDNLHKKKLYAPLFTALNRNINFFLHSYGYNLDKFDVHLTKAWATYTAKDQYISSHKHTASHYSCVYYVRNNDMGNIKFEEELAAQTGLYIPPTDHYIREWNNFNFASFTIPVATGDFVIFPSCLLHYTEINKKDEPRISISADILLTMKKGISTEHCIPHPSQWASI